MKNKGHWMLRGIVLKVLGVVAFCLATNLLWAEPYLAVRAGMDCAQCHVNPTGGGARNAFGNIYSQTQLTAETVTLPQPWTGKLAQLLNVGANARYSAKQSDVSGVDTNLEFATEQFTVYLGAEILDRLTVYVDQQVAPGGSLNREAWMKLKFGDFYVKAGRMFLPFGWRLQDNSSFVRQVSGINMLQGDDGAEIGWHKGNLVAQLAVTNGNGGGAERDDGKQFTARFARVGQGWQAGFSLVDNNTDTLDRSGGGVFAGLKTGEVSWLLEYDRLEDNPEIGLTDEIDVIFLEANWQITRGHNLKLTAEQIEFHLDPDEQQRYSAVYEYTPLPFAQLRLGYRVRDSDADNAFLNSDQAFLELHGFF